MKRKMNQNQHIEEYLKQYREMKDADFAVMITGAWGSGKTHFIKNYLEQECTQEGEKEYIYVSLNGISSTADIDMALFQVAHPVLGSKLAVTAGKIFKASLRAGLKINLDVNNDGTSDGNVGVDPMAGISIAGFNLSTKGRLLVFDDLERCLLNAEEVLGYINAFVEGKDAKVILIGEEGHLKKKSDATYQVIKEKVIGKTFRLVERIETVFDDLISSDIFPETHEVVQRNRDYVISMFRLVADKKSGTGQYNYRALKHAFRDFECFYPNIEPRFRENEEFKDALFRVFIVLSYEKQLGNWIPEQLITVDLEQERVADVAAQIEGQEKKESHFDLVLRRHGLQEAIWTSKQSIFLKALWGRIFANEWIDPNELSEAIQNTSYFPADQVEWVELWYWQRNEDSVSEQAMLKVQEKLENFGYRHYEIIMHVYSILVELAERGAVEGITKEEVFNAAQEYLNALVSQQLLLIPEEDSTHRWFGNGSHNLGYWVKENNAKRLRSMVDDAIAQSVEQERVASVDSWVEQIKSGNSEFLHELGTSGKYSQEPVLKYVDPVEFVLAINQAPNYTKWSFGINLGKRYEYYSELLINELLFWEKVVEEVGRLVDQYEGLVTPSQMNMRQIKTDAEGIVQTLHEAIEMKKKRKEEADAKVKENSDEQQ